MMEDMVAGMERDRFMTVVDKREEGFFELIKEDLMGLFNRWIEVDLVGMVTCIVHTRPLIGHECEMASFHSQSAFGVALIACEGMVFRRKEA